MRHATPDALDRLEPLLVVLREVPSLREKSRGAFYRRSKAFLHFHEDPLGLFADVRLGGATFERVRVTTKQEQRHFLRLVRDAVRSEAS